MQNRNLVIGVGVAIGLLVLGLVILLVSNGKASDGDSSGGSAVLIVLIAALSPIWIRALRRWRRAAANGS